MLEWIKKKFGLDYETKYQKRLQMYIAALPTASGRIVICSSHYKPLEFNCEAVVYTSDFVEWLEDHYSRCSVSFNAQILLSWLPKANIQDNNLFYLPIELLQAIDGYESSIINSCRSNIICGFCNNIFDRVDQKNENVVVAGRIHEGTTIWHCPNGHIIYRHNFKIRFF